MSIPLPTYDAPSSVAFSSKLLWFMKEQVVIEWQDRDGQLLYLGNPSPLNKNTNLVLWAGQNEEDKSLVVMLQLTTVYYISARKKKIDVFLVPDDLQMEVDCDSVITMDDVPPSVMFEQAQGSSSKSMRILRLSLQKRSPSHTVMPVRRSNNPKPLGGTPLHLMLSARAFSEEATAFDAYIPFSTYAVAAWKRTMSAIEEGYSIADFDLNRMYNHNGGGYDLWDAYVDTKTSRTASEVDLDPRHPPKTKRLKHDGGITEPIQGDHDEVPPPYVGSSFRSLNKLDDVQVQVAASDGFVSPPRYSNRSGSTVPVTPIELLRKGRLESPFTCGPFSCPQSGTATALQHVPLDTRFEPILPENAAISLQQCFINWLYEMKKLDSSVHELPAIYSLLVSFGSAVQKSDIARIPIIKSECTFVILKRHVTVHSDPPMSLAPGKLVKRLIRWMCSIILDADVALIDDLTLLMRKAVAWSQFIEQSSIDSITEQQLAEGAALEQDYMFHEAICVASFFTTYGGVLSRQTNST